MVTSGLVAVLIKVAGVGLLEDCLGKTLGQMQGKLTKLVSLAPQVSSGESGCGPTPSWKQADGLNSHPFTQNGMYGLHICGEGGEYETLTLDCPLFHDRVQL